MIPSLWEAKVCFPLDGCLTALPQYWRLAACELVSTENKCNSLAVSHSSITRASKQGEEDTPSKNMPFTRQTISLVISAIRALQLRAIIGCPDLCAWSYTATKTLHALSSCHTLQATLPAAGVISRSSSTRYVIELHAIT
jgi:hypothetical protein